VGLEDGIFVGLSLMYEGKAVGDGLGWALGIDEGVGVGIVDGIWLGDGVGFEEGIGLGNSVGETDGKPEGPGVGTLVGGKDGIQCILTKTFSSLIWRLWPQ